PRTGKYHAARSAINPGGSDREKENGTADVLHHEAVQLAEHVTKRGARAKLRHRLAVEAVRDQSRADAVTGNVEDEQIQMIVILRGDENKVAADAADGMIVSVDAEAAPHERLGRKGLLHAGRERQFVLDFLLALLELDVGLAKLGFGALLLGNVGEGNDRELAAVGIFQPARADDHRQAI